MTDRSFAELIEQLRAGDEDAASQLFARFTPRLIGLAQGHLQTWLRRREDPEDVIQSVYRSFFVRCRNGQFLLSTWGDAWKLLTVITLRKCADRADRARAQRRDAGREVKRPAGLSSFHESWQAVDPEPTPEQALLLAETVEELLMSFDAEDRPIIELSLQGYTAQEISERAGRAERTVQRVRQQARKRLQRMQGFDD